MNNNKLGRNFNRLMIIGILKVELFFSITALFGYTYLGSESSSIYVIIMIGIGVLNIGIGLSSIGVFNRHNLVTYFLLFGFPLVTFVSFIFERTISSASQSFINSQFNSYLAFTLPSLFAGFYVSEKKLDIFKLVYLCMLIITAGAVNAILLPFINQTRFTVMGGASYQAASYYSAFAFGINLYFLLYIRNHTKSKIFLSKTLRVIQAGLLLLQGIMVIIPGGRGAFVLMISYVLVSAPRLFFNKNIMKVIIMFLLLLPLIYILSLVFGKLMGNDFFIRGFKRATAFIGSGGTLNWEGSSGRLPIYLNSLEVFRESPVIGYGLYGYVEKINYGGYPHNIFLEILLQGGLVYLTIWFGAVFNLANKMIRMVKNDKSNLLLLYLGMYPIVELMFSGSYLSTGIFWYVIMTVVSSTSHLPPRTECFPVS